MKKPISYRLGELFCGTGGLGRGAFDTLVAINKEYPSQVAGIRPVWASDYDKDSCETYCLNNVGNRDTRKVFCVDAKNLEVHSLPEIDGFAFSFPCNDFSQTGKRLDVDGRYGGLYRHGIRVIDYQKPKFFVAENVSGIKGTHSGRNFKMILDELAEAGNGYNITTHLYNANDYNVPQNRKRIIIVGLDRTLNLRYRVPVPGNYQRCTGQTSESVYVPPVVKDVLELPFADDVTNHEKVKHTKKVIERLECIKPGESAWTATLPERLQINCKDVKATQLYRRLEPNKPSYAITASGGGGNYIYHYRCKRSLTNRERARLQGFPDSYVFSGNKESVRKQIGAATPPPLSLAVFTAVIKTLHGIDYEFIEPSEPEAQR